MVVRWTWVPALGEVRGGEAHIENWGRPEDRREKSQLYMREWFVQDCAFQTFGVGGGGGGGLKSEASFVPAWEYFAVTGVEMSRSGSKKIYQKGRYLQKFGRGGGNRGKASKNAGLSPEKGTPLEKRISLQNIKPNPMTGVEKNT